VADDKNKKVDSTMKSLSQKMAAHHPPFKNADGSVKVGKPAKGFQNGSMKPLMKRSGRGR